MNTIHISFPGGRAVTVHNGTHLVPTDQPVSAGGQDTAVAPYDLFLSSIAACAGYYALSFCEARGIDPNLVQVRQHTSFSPESKLADHIELEVTLAPDFPAKYASALLRSIDTCKVKRSLASPPELATRLIHDEPSLSSSFT